MKDPAKCAETASSPSEAELVSACRHGEISAFETLFEQHGSRMKSVAFNLLGNKPDAEDAVQEAFIKVFRGIRQFRGNSRLSTWVFRILVNTCFDIRKRRGRVQEISLDAEQPVEPAGVGEGPRDVPLRLALERALVRLNPRYRTIFVLYEVEGFTHSEIARILDIPEGTSKNGLFQAKRELQSALGSRRRQP